MVPRGEIEARLARFQAALGEAGLAGALLVYSTDLHYLAGTVQNAHLVVPAAGEPALLVRRNLERARRESPLDRVEPLRSLRDLPAAVAAAGIAGGRLGLELDVLPAAAYLRYAAGLEGLELVDCSRLLRRLRAVKSAWELERHREAGAQVARASAHVPGALRPGMTEVELAAEVERLLRREGHQGFVPFRAFDGVSTWVAVLAGPSGAVPGGSDTPLVGTGPSIAVSKGASHRPIEPGEPIVVDIVGTSGGYLADQTRVLSLGPLREPFPELFAASRAILHAVAAAARPGVAWSALFAHAQELAAGREGFMGAGEERVSFVGHGLGLEVDEPPYLARGFDGDALEAGMVFALEPKFVVPGAGAVGCENSYAVAEGGVECLTRAPEALVEL